MQRVFFFSREHNLNWEISTSKTNNPPCPAFSVSHSLETFVYFVHNFRYATLTAEKNSPLIFKLSS